jgi:hypothetical protein
LAAISIRRPQTASWIFGTKPGIGQHQKRPDVVGVRRRAATRARPPCRAWTGHGLSTAQCTCPPSSRARCAP